MGLKTDMSKMFSLENSFKKIEQQHKVNQKALSDQNRIEAENEKQMLQARYALENSLSDKTRVLNEKIYAHIVKNNEKVKQKIKESNSELEKSGTLLNDVRGKLQSVANSIHKDIKQGLKSFKIAPDMDLEKNTRKLQEFRAQATALQKTKLVDVRSDIERIDVLIQRLKELQRQQKQKYSLTY